MFYPDRPRSVICVRFCIRCTLGVIGYREIKLFNAGKIFLAMSIMTAWPKGRLLPAEIKAVELAGVGLAALNVML